MCRCVIVDPCGKNNGPRLLAILLRTNNNKNGISRSGSRGTANNCVGE